MDRYIIRNYGSSRNLPDGRGSYIFMERESARETNDEELAKLFAAYPDVHVADRGGATVVAAPPAPPEGPLPPAEEPEDNDDQSEDNDNQGEEPEGEQGEENDYSDLLVADLQEIAEERSIPITGLLKADLVEALLQNDAQKKLTIGQRVKCDDEDEEYVVSAVSEDVDGEFTIQNKDGEEFFVRADQLTVIN